MKMSYFEGSFLDQNKELLKILDIHNFKDFEINEYTKKINSLMGSLSPSGERVLPKWRRGQKISIKKKNEIITKSIQTRYDTNIKNYIFHIRDLFKKNEIEITQEVNTELKIIELILLSISIEGYLNLCLQKIENDWHLFQKKEPYVHCYKNYKNSKCRKFKDKKCIDWKYSNTITKLFFIIDLVSLEDFHSEQVFKPIIDLIEFRNEIVHVKNKEIQYSIE